MLGSPPARADRMRRSEASADARAAAKSGRHDFAVAMKASTAASERSSGTSGGRPTTSQGESAGLVDSRHQVPFGFDRQTLAVRDAGYPALTFPAQGRQRPPPSLAKDGKAQEDGHQL